MNWEKRKKIIARSQNVMWESLVHLKMILMLPIHIEFKLMKKLVKALNLESAAFKLLLSKLPEAKIKGRVLVRPQIKKISESTLFYAGLKKQLELFLKMLTGF